MIILAQDFMDILRIKKEDDIVIEEEAEEVDGRRIDPSEREGKTGTQLVDEKRRKKEREAKEGEGLAETDKKRKLESATTISMWKEILEKYSKTNDVSDPTMRGTIREFSKSYLIPRSTSKRKIDNFYQSIISQEADTELLKLFFDDAKDLGIEISGDTDAIDLSKVEKTYNGRESLEVLRSFFEDAAGIKRSVLTGKKVSDSAFRKIKEMLRDTQSIDVDELGENPSTLLSQFRQLVLTLDRLKEEQEKTLSKSADPSQSPIPDFIQRKIEAEVDKETKDIKDKEEREKEEVKVRQKLSRAYRDGKFPESTPESREARRRIFENLSSAAQRTTQKVREGREKNIQELEDRINSDESLLEELQQKLSQTPTNEQTKIKSKIRATEKQIREAQITLEQKYKIKKPKEDKSEDETTIDTKDTTWEYNPQDDEEDITTGFSYLGETEVFDNFRSVSKTVSQIIDKIEDMLQYVLDLRNRETDSDKAKVLDNTRNKMIQLVKVTVGNFEFIVGKDKFRAIKIN
tara:strand:- start:1593 stop:3149 length:1557 start_codon:yes stop_codon:yes gene_type:complete